MKINTRKALFEFCSILIAVVLAMGLTEWRQEVLNNNQAEKSYKSILEEIQNNHDNLKPDSVIIQELIEKIDLWLDSPKDVRDTLSSFDYELNLLSKSAWEVAKLNGSMTYIENRRLQSVSLIYEFHDFYMDTGRDVFDVLTDLSKLDKESREYEGVMRAMRIKISLTFNAMVGYLQSSRELLARNQTILSSD
jgi:hypothetical protein